MTPESPAGIGSPITRQVVLVLDDDVLVTEGLSLGLEHPGRTVITCNDLESAQLAVHWFKLTHVVADVRLTGPFGFEGLDFIHYVRQHSPETRVILMTGDASDALQMEASERGAVAFLQKPFGGRKLEAVINVMSPQLELTDAPPVHIRIPMLDEIIAGDLLYPVFQPIIDLSKDWRPFGYEALARCRTDGPFQNPNVLFEYAARRRRVPDLELACIERALKSAAPLPADASLFLNIHPFVFSAGSRLHDMLAGQAGDLLPRIVLEVTEQAALTDSPAVFHTIEQIRELGVRFAFDDFGDAYSHLTFIDRVRPSFLKISQKFGTRFESNPTKVKIVTNIMAIARDFDCDLILEGIEDSSTAEAGASLGIRHGQGYLFGRPTEIAAFTNSSQAGGPTPRSS